MAAWRLSASDSLPKQAICLVCMSATQVSSAGGWAENAAGAATQAAADASASAPAITDFLMARRGMDASLSCGANDCDVTGTAACPVHTFRADPAARKVVLTVF